jgi:hypothetical protein
MAVKNGIPPVGPGSIEVKEGNWCAVGNDMYLRGFPGPYYKTVVEVYRPNPVAIEYDSKNRITSIDNGITKAEFVYNDEPGQYKINFEGKDYPIWRFNSVKFTFSPDEEVVYENTGWMLPSTGKKRNRKGGSQRPTGLMGDPLKVEYEERINIREEIMEITEEYIVDKLKGELTSDAIEKVLDQTNYSNLENKEDIIEAMEAALSQDPNVKGEWITKNEMMTMDMWMQTINAITFNDKDPDDKNTDNSRKLQNFDEERFRNIQAEKEAKKLKYINFLEVPGNTYGQRIGISLREFKQ